MSDPNIFAVITACDEYALGARAIRMDENSQWLREGAQTVAEQATATSRASTPDIPQQAEEDNNGPEPLMDALVITFDQLMTSPISGLRFGTDPRKCHVLLGQQRMPGVSRLHFEITVSGDLNIWLRDIGSRFGTAVGYDGQHVDEKRTHESWLLSGAPDSQDRLPEDRIIRAGNVGIRINFPNHWGGSQPYIDNLTRFANKCNEALGAANTAVPTLSRLVLNTAIQTEGATVHGDPRSSSLYLCLESLGEGSSGHVWRAVKLRDGKIFAIKCYNRPADSSNRKRKVGRDISLWLHDLRREFGIMQNASHDNIMRVREVQEDPECMVVMDYFPLGNIGHAVLDLPDQVIAFGQLLQGVAYLHEAEVVHGNIKPENIMIQRLPVFKVVIADIGLSAVDDYSRMTKTFWSAAKYQAPERFPGITKLFDSFSNKFALIDVWSLGVIMLELSHGLPQSPKWPDSAVSLSVVLQSEWKPLLDCWLGRIFDKLDHILNHNDPAMVKVVELLTYMLQDEPDNRPSARKCLDTHFRELNSHEQVNTESPVDTTSEHDPVFSSSDDDDWEAEAQGGGSPMVETTSDAQHDLAESLVDAEASLSSPIADDSEESQDSEESEEL